MPAIRTCKTCGQKNRLAANHLADTGRCGACKIRSPHSTNLCRSTWRLSMRSESSRVPVLVDFGRRCGPCRCRSRVARTAKDMAGQAIVLKVDTDKHQQLAARFAVRGIPNFAVFASGKLIKQQAGVVDHNVMEGWLRSAVPTPSV